MVANSVISGDWAKRVNSSALAVDKLTKGCVRFSWRPFSGLRSALKLLNRGALRQQLEAVHVIGSETSAMSVVRRSRVVPETL